MLVTACVCNLSVEPAFPQGAHFQNAPFVYWALIGAAQLRGQQNPIIILLLQDLSGVLAIARVHTFTPRVFRACHMVLGLTCCGVICSEEVARLMANTWSLEEMKKA